MVELDGGTVGVLLAHRLTQDAERQEWGIDYVDHGLVFAREDGNPLPLDHVTKRFRSCARRPGCDRSACMICGTAPRRSCSRQASISHSCRSVSVTVR